MGQLKRQLVMWSAIAVTAAVLPGLALAENASPAHEGGRHGRGDHGHHHEDAKLSVVGRAISRGTTDSYGLQIRGRSGNQPTEADGLVRFGHKGQDVREGLEGEITCLSKDAAGAVMMSGTITRSGKRTRGDTVKAPTADDAAFLEEILSSDEAGPAHDRKGKRGDRGRRGGGELAGKDFAFTIAVDGKPQRFSQPTIGDKGTLAACSGGGTPTLEVTRGGFRAHEAGDDKAKDGDDAQGKDDRDGRKGRRGWWRR